MTNFNLHLEFITFYWFIRNSFSCLAMKSKTLLNWEKRVLKPEKNSERLFKIVDKVLRQIFGEPATLFIYKYLEEKYSLKRENIPNEPEIFAEGLEKYLSHFGASVILQTLFNESSELKLMKTEEKKFLKQLKELKRLSYE